MKAVELIVRAIKCDAPGCGYRTEEGVEDYALWLNRPCPKCGANLLTPKDLAAMNAMFAGAEYCNVMAGPRPEGTEYELIHLSLDGTGSVSLRTRNE